MGWVRDLSRIYTLAAGAFCVVSFFEILLFAAVARDTLVTFCAALSIILLIIGSFLIYFGLQLFEGFFETITARPATMPPYTFGPGASWEPYPQWYHYYYQFYYPYQHYYYPAHYQYYQSNPLYRPYYQGTGYQQSWPAEIAGYGGGARDWPSGAGQPPPTSSPKALELPPAWMLMAIFITAIFAGGASLAMWSEAPVATVLTFPVAFVIGFSFPSLIWISYFYSFDGDPAPARAVLVALTCGMLSTIPALYVNSLSSLALGGGAIHGTPILLVVAGIAPLVEEFVKPLGLIAVKENVRGRLHGLIYGVTCGMGFALIENISYELSFLYTGEDPAAVWTLGSLARGLASIAIHAVGTGAVGYAYGRLRSDGPGALRGIPLAYLTAVALHSIWNGTATFFESLPWGWVVAIPFMVVFALGGFLGLRAFVERARAREAAVANFRAMERASGGWMGGR
ncbi:MAG: PrsW family intramembrane metalloprotease [Thermoplasmata archaeon]